MRRQGLWRMAAVGLFWLLVWGGGQTAVAQSAEETPTLAQYWAQIGEMREQISAEMEAPAADQAAQLDAVSRDLEALTHVRLDVGRLYAVDHTVLVNALRSESISAEEALHLFDALLTESAITQPPTTYDPQPIATILADRDFDYGTGEENWLQRQWRTARAWLFRQLTQLFQIDGLSPEVNGVLRIGITVMGALLLVLVLLFGMRDVLRQLVDNATSTPENAQDNMPLTAEIALSRAEHLSHGGDYRSAVRYLYLSTLLLLEERDVLQYNRSLTNREYLRTLADKPDLANILRDVIDVFDNVWYGYRTLDEQEYKQYEARVKQLKGQRQ